MKEFTSTVTLTFDINNHEAIDKNDYIERLKEQMQKDCETSRTNLSAFELSGL